MDNPLSNCIYSLFLHKRIKRLRIMYVGVVLLGEWK